MRDSTFRLLGIFRSGVRLMEICARYLCSGEARIQGSFTRVIRFEVSVYVFADISWFRRLPLVLLFG